MDEQMEGERIIINLDSESESGDESYVQYEIEYAPKKDVLKYGTHWGKPYKLGKGDHKFSSLLPLEDENDEIYDSSFEAIEQEKSNESGCEKSVDVSIEELINVHLTSIIDRQCAVASNTQKTPSSSPQKSSHKDKIIYLDDDEEKNPAKVTAQSSSYIQPIKIESLTLEIDSYSVQKVQNSA
jgi:hypothetical protein